MAVYLTDRQFSDRVFRNFVIPSVYPNIGWSERAISPIELDFLDMNKGIDALALNEIGASVSLQYRFRDRKYSNFSDVTLRYEREHNPDPARRKSEFFKIEADYLLYGTSKFSKDYSGDHILDRWAVVDLKELLRFIENGSIIIDSESSSFRCTLRGNALVCPVNHNKDKSSSFVPFDIGLLSQLFGREIVPFQHGRW